MIVDLKDAAVADGRLLSCDKGPRNNARCDLETFIACLGYFDTPAERGALAYGFFGRDHIVADVQKEITEMGGDPQNFIDFTSELDSIQEAAFDKAVEKVDDDLLESLDSALLDDIRYRAQTIMKNILGELQDDLRTAFHREAKDHELEV